MFMILIYILAGIGALAIGFLGYLIYLSDKHGYNPSRPRKITFSQPVTWDDALNNLVGN